MPLRFHNLADQLEQGLHLNTPQVSNHCCSRDTNDLEYWGWLVLMGWSLNQSLNRHWWLVFLLEEASRQTLHLVPC